jgi:hypothetical protein
MQIVKVHAVDFSIATSQTVGTADLTSAGFTTLSKMVVFATWSVTHVADTALGGGSEFVDIYPSSTTLLTAERNTASATRTCNIRAYVIEFGDDTNVYKGTFTMTDTATSHTGVSIGGTVAIDDAFVWHYLKAIDNTSSIPDWEFGGNAVRPTFASTTTLDFTRGTGETTVTGHWYVVESSTLTVQHVQHTLSGSGSSSTTDTFTSVGADLSHTFHIAAFTTSANQYPDENLWQSALTATDTITFTRGDGGSHSFIYDYQVITDSATSVQRGTSTSTSATGTTDLPGGAVDITRSIIKSGLGTSPSVSSGQFGNGECSSRFREFYFVDSDTMGWESTLGATSPTFSWEVVQFDAESGEPPPASRIMVIT